MASITVASAVSLPEPYWAAVSTIIVTQSTLGTAFEISVSRFAGTAVGCTAAVLLGTLLGTNVIVFGTGVLGLGLLCLTTGLSRAAYRFAGISMCIVMMVRRSIPLWQIGIHRFVEVSIGILVGLVMAAVWPLREPPEE
jgi:uncharacterized membrane protein YccC